MTEYHLLGPFNIENKMIISKSWHSCDGSGCILPTVETDKGESLQGEKKFINDTTESFCASGLCGMTLTWNYIQPHYWCRNVEYERIAKKLCTDLRLSGVLVFGQVDPWDGAKRSEELLQVSLTGVLRKIGHTNSSIVISCGLKTYDIQIKSYLND